MSEPAISVVMPVHNGGDFVAEAVGSVLDQSFADFEFLVVDDASTDQTAEVLAGFADTRLRVVRQPVQMGVAAAMNVGMALAQGGLIARMDADDIALPDRLMVQSAFMRDNPDIIVSGADIELFGDITGTTQCDCGDGQIKAQLMAAAGNIMNPTAIFRADFVRRHDLHCNPSYFAGSDYAFWVDCMLAGASFANLRQVLVRYRYHGANVSVRPGRWGIIDRIRRTVIAAYFPALSHDETALLSALHDMPADFGFNRFCAAIAAAEKAKGEARSIFGEDKARLAGIIDDRIRVAKKAMPG